MAESDPKIQGIHEYILCNFNLEWMFSHAEPRIIPEQFV